MSRKYTNGSKERSRWILFWLVAYDPRKRRNKNRKIVTHAIILHALQFSPYLFEMCIALQQETKEINNNQKKHIVWFFLFLFLLCLFKFNEVLRKAQGWNRHKLTHIEMPITWRPDVKLLWAEIRVHIFPYFLLQQIPSILHPMWTTLQAYYNMDIKSLQFVIRKRHENTKLFSIVAAAVIVLLKIFLETKKN